MVARLHASSVERPGLSKGAVGLHPLPQLDADRFGAAIAVKMAAGLFDVARAIVDRAEQEAVAMSRDRAAASPADESIAAVLPLRLVAPLEACGCLTVAQLLELDDSDLLSLRGFGPSSIRAIDIALEKLRLRRRHAGLSLVGEADRAAVPAMFARTKAKGRRR